MSTNAGREGAPMPLLVLTEDEQLFRDNIRKFAEESIGPLVKEMDEKGVMDHSLVEQFHQLGLMGIEIPEQYGGGQMFLGEEKGERINLTRARELAATGAGTVAAACPFCASMFRDALKAVSDHPPQLLDIAQIAARGLGDAENMP